MISVKVNKERFLKERDKEGIDIGVDPYWILHAMQEVNNWCSQNCSYFWEWKGLYEFHFMDESDAAYFAMVWS